MKALGLLNRYRRWLSLDRKYLLTAGLVVVAYVLAAKLGLALAYTTQQVTAVWPPSGIALAVVLLLGYRYAPSVFLGAFLANLMTQEPVFVALGIGIGNTLEAVAGAYLLRRLVGFRNTFRTMQDAMVFGLAGALAPAIAATIGTLSLSLGGLVEWDRFGAVWQVWWFGDVLGILMFAPFLLVYLNGRMYRSLNGRRLEAGLWLALLFAASMALFTAESPHSLAFLYLLFPFMIWAAIRFTQLGVVTGTMLISVMAVWATVNGFGPFGEGRSIETNLIQMQLFVLVVSATSLLLALAITERFAAEEELKRQVKERERLEAELKEANKRVTHILEDVLENGSKQ